jgi:hypothetical protein
MQNAKFKMQSCFTVQVQENNTTQVNFSTNPVLAKIVFIICLESVNF